MEPWTLLLLVAVVLALAGGAAWFLVRRRRAGTRGEAAPPLGPADLLRRGLDATRRRLLEQIDAVLGRGARGLPTVLSELEEVLVAADVGVRTTTALLERVRADLGEQASGDDIRRALAREMVRLLDAPPAPTPTGKPWVILVTGVNGVGKTTTIGKLAAQHIRAGRKVLVVAADTFRAAAIEQLEVWAHRVGADLVKHGPGADPSAVVFDGMRAAVARDADVVFVDTAGRLHTRAPLMDELRKVRRVIGREIPGAPHETLLVVDATTGQNAVRQAQSFGEAVEVSGIVLTKLDGTAKGGVVLALRHELEVPVRYVGIGEGVDDLRPFDAETFVASLFGAEAQTSQTGSSGRDVTSPSSAVQEHRGVAR